MVSELFDPDAWDPVPGFDLEDITYHRAKAHGTVRVAFDRPEVRNAFRPSTVDEALSAAMKTELRRIKVSGDKMAKSSEVLNSIWESALDHLVDVRGLDRQQSWSALTARLVKKRRCSPASG